MTFVRKRTRPVNVQTTPAPATTLAARRVQKASTNDFRRLDDVLFTSGRADPKASAASTFDRVVAILNQNPERNVVIEGHTDNIGSDDYNLGLSQRRADSVKSFLTQQGIDSRRIVATGKSEHQLIADNESEGGRQKNRRVEAIIDNPAPAVVST